ncbi:hypothetical protein [Salinisphaera shabanensis]
MSALWDGDYRGLDAIYFLPIGLAAGAICGRLFDPTSESARSTRA